MITWDVGSGGVPGTHGTPIQVHKCKSDEKHFRNAEENSSTASII